MIKKIALVTGSTKGIGKQIGLDLLQKNYFVYFNYANDVESAQELQNNLDLSGYSGQFVILQGNLSTYEGAHDLLDKIHENLDCIVFNVGITDRTPFGTISIQDWDKVFRTNLFVPFFIIQTLKDKININGRLIFISSVSGLSTDSVSIAYGVSKGAIHILVPYLAKEFKEKKITVNAIASGYIDTDWHKGKSEAQLNRIKAKHLVNRLGTTEEVAKVVLAIVDNGFINGQTIRVDGGFGIA